MPITYHIDSARNLVVTHAVGVLTDEDVLRHKHRLAADPDFTAGMCELSDVRGVTDLRITPEGVRAMVSTDVSHASRLQAHKLAIVAAEDVVFGMARMYEVLAERHGPSVGVFRDVLEAARWLGVQAAE
jgi:hypothetical protein